MKPQAKKTFALQFFVEPLMGFSDYAERRMFGCLAIYLGQRNYLVLAENPNDSNWNGILLPTDLGHHSSLMAQFTGILPHPILKKWLYLPLAHPEFETQAEALVACAAKRDPRLGILSGASAGKKRKPKPWANLGPKSRLALSEVGITRPEQLKKLGWKKVVEKVIRQSSEFLNLNFAVAIQGAILGRDWRSFSSQEKAPLEKWIREQRRKRKQNPSKPSKKTKKKTL